MLIRKLRFVDSNFLFEEVYPDILHTYNMAVYCYTIFVQIVWLNKIMFKPKTRN